MQTPQTPRDDQEAGADLREDKNLLKGRDKWAGFDAAQKFTEIIKGHARMQWATECWVETF